MITDIVLGLLKDYQEWKKDYDLRCQISHINGALVSTAQGIISPKDKRYCSATTDIDAAYLAASALGEYLDLHDQGMGLQERTDRRLMNENAAATARIIFFQTLKGLDIEMGNLETTAEILWSTGTDSLNRPNMRQRLNRHMCYNEFKKGIIDPDSYSRDIFKTTFDNSLQ